jgi:hypothetical protein
MSNQPTNFTINNQDLSAIFQPLTSGGTKAPTTGFKLSDGSDLNTIFDPSTNGIIITYDTGFNVNGIDLRYFFAAYKTVFNTTHGSFQNQSGTLFLNNTMPSGYTNFNFVIYGAGGSSKSYDTTITAGAGSGAFIKAISIPYKSSSIFVESITYKSNSVTVNYSDGNNISLTAGNGSNATSSTGSSGGTATVTNTTSFYSSSNITKADGNTGGNRGANGNKNNTYTSSGSGLNPSTSWTAGLPPIATNTFSFTDGSNIKISSAGGGAISQNQSDYQPSAYGGGGSAIANGVYGGNISKVFNGASGIVIYYLS